MIHIAVSTLNFQTAESTIRCVDSIIRDAQPHSTYRVSIVVGDNGSDRQDVERLRRGLAGEPQVMLREYTRNLGFAAGHNRNVEAITAVCRPDFVWLINSDCLVQPGCIEELVSCAKQAKQVGILGATLIDRGGQTIQCAGGCLYNGWLSTYSNYGQGKPLTLRNQLASVEFSYISGACLFLPFSTLENGLLPPRRRVRTHSSDSAAFLNETFFLYFEELDLAYRLRPGLALAWCRGALIRHEGGASAGTGDGERSALAEYHSTLSALKFTYLYCPGRLWVVAPFRFLAKSAQLLLAGKFGLMGAVSTAYRDFWQWLHDDVA